MGERGAGLPVFHAAVHAPSDDANGVSAFHAAAHVLVHSAHCSYTASFTDRGVCKHGHEGAEAAAAAGCLTVVCEVAVHGECGLHRAVYHDALTRGKRARPISARGYPARSQQCRAVTLIQSRPGLRVRVPSAQRGPVRTSWIEAGSLNVLTSAPLKPYLSVAKLRADNSFICWY